MPLRDFIVERDDPLTAYDVTCPRKECGRMFVVDDKWPVIQETAEGARPYGRSCPYCCYTAAIPEALRRTTVKAKPKTNKPRRTVRRRKSKGNDS